MISSAFLRPASSVSLFLLYFQAYSTFYFIFFYQLILTSFLERSSNVYAIISPCRASYIAFLNLYQCYLSRIYSAQFSGRLGILATIRSYSMRASLFSFPSYMIFCWALPLKILCRNSIATSLLMESLVLPDSFCSSLFDIPDLNYWMFILLSVLQFGVLGLAMTFLSASISLLTTSSSLFQGFSFLSIFCWATSKAFLWAIDSLASFYYYFRGFSEGTYIYARPLYVLRATGCTSYLFANLSRVRPSLLTPA